LRSETLSIFKLYARLAGSFFRVLSRFHALCASGPEDLFFFMGLTPAKVLLLL
jgi:hypothetical protein